jgi:hypothetical protein
MNKSLLLILLSIFVSFFSCQKESSFQGETADFGTVDYYNSFLFFEPDTLALTKNLKYNFNAYSIEKKSSVTIKLVDTIQNIISNKNIQFFINGNLIENNNFTLDSKETQTGDLKIGLKFLPDYPSGYAYGYLSVSNHSLDVINNNDLNSSKEKRLFKWEANHRLIMNPLKKWMMWVGFFMLGALLTWFMVLRNKIYPKFKRGNIQILSPYFKGVTITKNTRLIVFTNSNKKQKSLNIIFTGKIIYHVNPIYEKDIFLRPGKRNKIKIKLPFGARINPMVNSLEKFNKYIIQIEKEKIEIQYS